jgi:hypothetical protein
VTCGTAAIIDENQRMFYLSVAGNGFKTPTHMVDRVVDANDDIY